MGGKKPQFHPQKWGKKPSNNNYTRAQYSARATTASLEQATIMYCSVHLPAYIISVLVKQKEK